MIKYKEMVKNKKLTGFVDDAVTHCCETDPNDNISPCNDSEDSGSVNNARGRERSNGITPDTNTFYTTTPLSQQQRWVLLACENVYARIGGFGRGDVVAELECDARKPLDVKTGRRVCLYDGFCGSDPTIRRIVGRLSELGYIIRVGRNNYKF